MIGLEEISEKNCGQLSIWGPPSAKLVELWHLLYKQLGGKEGQACQNEEEGTVLPWATPFAEQEEELSMYRGAGMNQPCFSGLGGEG